MKKDNLEEIPVQFVLSKHLIITTEIEIPKFLLLHGADSNNIACQVVERPVRKKPQILKIRFLMMFFFFNILLLVAVTPLL